MPYQGNPNHQWMDRVARTLTGRQVHTGRIGPKALIASALIFMAVGIGGLWLMVAGSDLGASLIYCAAIGTLALKLTGDWRARRDDPLDEREREIYWKANAVGAAVPLVGMIIWLLFLSTSAGDGLWRPSRDYEFSGLAFFLLAAMLQLAMIVIGLSTPSYAADLDEHD